MRKSLLATLATLGMLSAPFALASTIEIQVNNTMSEGGSESAAVERFAEYLEEQAPGRFNVRPFLAGSLGSEDGVLELLNLGQTQISITGGNWRQQYAPEYDAITVPFLFSTWDEVDAYMESPSGQRLVEIAEEKGGLKYFGTQHRGPRHMTANKAIHTPEDLQGFRLRLPSLPVWLEVWEGIGAQVVNVPAPEIYLALQTRQVDGHENSLSSPYTRRLWEVQDHIILTSHVQFPWNWVASSRWWNGLDEEDQALITEAIHVARQHGTEVERELDEYYLEELEKAGMTIIEPDIEAFREAAMPSIERVMSDMADGVLEDAMGNGND
ncbi:TRAP transporter substrate-binding protein [Halomonas desiderata]|uniref:TRAP transporter substrate-binding protein n=1 Tax=Billgrantia desiderata TaxID=52021 RepID=A0AAW4YSC4_9GAMM|nr:TRAP transporter substrate-binding protein [Halomonas desiderata]MCE8051000.1 TRAP transporter substrate-binding protein [Halomonas desiderata]NIC37367.1 TRAP transporter substrate-binding protein [Halomonas desiderata]OUE42643.1 C4-dicarboxylate ABC transporter substrate-binding protein [Halomonas desiderata SP1]SEF41750.1 TRAP-type C4-dicarboxylate transport system, substrate-binding protein [Halomonas desiderata]